MITLTIADTVVNTLLKYCTLVIKTFENKHQNTFILIKCFQVIHSPPPPPPPKKNKNLEIILMMANHLDAINYFKTSKVCSGLFSTFNKYSKNNYKILL